MWNWFNCYLSGRHDFGAWCEPGAIFLRCVHCGRRSPGWSMNAADQSAPMASRADRRRWQAGAARGSLRSRRRPLVSKPAVSKPAG